MATTTNTLINNWKTFHDNGPYASKLIQRTKLAKRADMWSKVDRYNDASAEIRRLIQLADQENEGFRALGSAWSLSNIAHHNERMHDNQWMALRFDIQPPDVHHSSPYNYSNLFLFQCGNRIKQISDFLMKRGKSLKTSGASNGQTIAGCISTGVHGSGLDIGSIQDYVVGINLIVGPHSNDIVYLERNSKPALTEAFWHQFNARVIRNDELFNAALVGLGSFGFIHSVVIEAEDLFLLNRYIKKIDKDRALNMALNMDFSGTCDIIPTEVDALGDGLRPFHYKIFVNPYNDSEDYVIELIYKKAYRTNYSDPLPRIRKAAYTDLITLFKTIIQRFPKLIPPLIQALTKSGTKIMPRVDAQTTGTLAETFWDTQYAGSAFAVSVGIDHSQCKKALEALIQMTKQNPIPGIFAMRFVKQTKATIGFTQFPITCMLEIDGVLWEGSDHIISLEKYMEKMLDVLESNNITYTLHWGKNAQWNRSGLIKHMYGAKANDWCNFRSALLGQEMAKIFSNPFLETTGLDQYQGASDDLITSLDLQGNPVA